MNQPAIDAKALPGLQDIWPQIQSSRMELATELEKLCADFPGLVGARIRRLADWFRGPAEFDSAIVQPDLVAVGLPFLALCSHRPGSNPAQFSSLEITHAARLGVCSLVSQPDSGNQRYWKILVYPTAVLIAAWLIWIAFSFWVAPQFEQMFLEFGISLPLITETMLGLSRFVRNWWLLIVALPVALGLELWVHQRISSRGRAHTSGLLSGFLTSRRDSIAVWAWHLSLLLESGVAESRAIAAAGDASDNTWLSKTSRTWSNQVSARQTNNQYSAPPAESQLFCYEPKYQLVNSVMSLPLSSAKIAMLRELSIYYWERGEGSGGWWMQWLALLIKFFLLAMIGVVVLSLLSPLLSLIGGLTRF